jgi:hypothetical protein
VALTSIADRDSGTIQLVGAKQFGNVKFATNAKFPQNLELYVTRGDDRYDPPLKCMVSNAVVMGKMKTTTRARDWTPEEIVRYTKAPLAYKNPNAHPTVGEDVPPLPNAAGLVPFRYVDPDGRLLGLDYHVGDWEKRKTVWRLAPVYSAGQPKQHAARSIARNLQRRPAQAARGPVDRAQGLRRRRCRGERGQVRSRHPPPFLPRQGGRHPRHEGRLRRRVDRDAGRR